MTQEVGVTMIGRALALSIELCRAAGVQRDCWVLLSQSGWHPAEKHLPVYRATTLLLSPGSFRHYSRSVDPALREPKLLERKNSTMFVPAFQLPEALVPLPSGSCPRSPRAC